MHPEQQNNGMNAFHFFIFIFKLIMTSMPLLSNVNGNFSDNLKKYRLLFVASTRIQCVPVVHSNEIAKKKKKKNGSQNTTCQFLLSKTRFVVVALTLSRKMKWSIYSIRTLLK